jgi:hypothetical protein
MNTTFTYFTEQKVKNNKNQIKALLGDNNFVFFFEKNKEIFGAPEESRLIFARMKNPESVDRTWVNDANFSGLNLNKALHGEKTENLFNISDLNKIKILNQEEAYDKLSKLTNDTSDIKTVLTTKKTDDVPPGMNVIKDKQNQ